MSIKQDSFLQLGMSVLCKYVIASCFSKVHVAYFFPYKMALLTAILILFVFSITVSDLRLDTRLMSILCGLQHGGRGLSVTGTIIRATSDKGTGNIQKMESGQMERWKGGLDKPRGRSPRRAGRPIPVSYTHLTLPTKRIV